MNTDLFEKWRREDLISDTSLQKAQKLAERDFFSVFWELRILLYLGVLLLSSGLGILIYKNIDTIGHTALIAAIALLSAGCFYYCIKNKRPFSWQKVEAPNAFFDYVLLLGCLTFVSFITYLQAQYEAFGTRYGLATFIPLVVLMVSAYFFDHLGVLSMGIVNLAAWAGIAITPARLLVDNNFSDARLIFTGVVLGILLVSVALLTFNRARKKHFAFTYANFGVHLLLVSCIAALFEFEQVFTISFFVMAGISAVLFRLAWQHRSFYFILIITLYTYFGLSYVLLNWVTYVDGAVYIICMWFIGSGIGLMQFLKRINTKLKKA